MSKKFWSFCNSCGSKNIYYQADMIVKGYGYLNKDGTIDELTDNDIKPLKTRIIGYICFDCDYEVDHRGNYDE